MEIKMKSLIERGACYIKLQNYERAISELNRAITLSEDDGKPEALYGRYLLAACYEKTRRLDLAVEQWERIYRKKSAFKGVAEKLNQGRHKLNKSLQYCATEDQQNWRDNGKDRQDSARGLMMYFLT